MREGELLWTPPPERFADSHLARFTRWVERERGLTFEDYEALWRWSVSDLQAFWGYIWDYFEVVASVPYARALTGDEMLGASWFEGAQVNFAEHALRHEASATAGEVVFHHSSETREVATMTWSELGSAVRRLAERLRDLGIRPGDRIVSYMPNIPETAIAMLATVAVGAIWSAAAPEFGAAMVTERFGQIGPKLAFVADGYTFGGKLFDRRADVATITGALPTLETLVWLDYSGLEPTPPTGVATHTFADLLAGAEVPRELFRYERVTHLHPLWILFSSGTTGPPKAIAHSHVGIVVEQLKVLGLHTDLGPGKRMFFYTTTGWMMWNSVMCALLTGAGAVLYDGSPVHGGIDALWRIAAESGATLVGASPTLVTSMKTAKVRPGQTHDLSRVDTIMVGGAPSTPETFSWFYDAISPNLWVTSPSGGTELCSAIVGGVPGRPVYAGEIGGSQLGIAAAVFDATGTPTIGEVGELVITKPFPSQPLYFWGDVGNQRYHDSYFDTFPGVWRHGDFAKVNERGGWYIYGRSDSTLNRFGVRIGSAEIYRVLENLPEIADSLVICCETGDGGHYMPLFVALRDGEQLDESLRARIARELRERASPRHVPDEIHQAPAIPYTLTGKKMEVPVRKLVMGTPPVKAASRDAMASPAAFDWYVEFAAKAESKRRLPGPTTMRQ